MASRFLGGIGRFFITTGLVVLLFVGYQLWGTGLQEASAQNSLGDDFDSLLEEATLDAPATTTTTTAAPVATTAAPATTTTTTTTIPAAGGTIPVEDEALERFVLDRDGSARSWDGRCRCCGSRRGSGGRDRGSRGRSRSRRSIQRRFFKQ